MLQRIIRVCTFAYALFLGGVGLISSLPSHEGWDIEAQVFGTALRPAISIAVIVLGFFVAYRMSRLAAWFLIAVAALAVSVEVYSLYRFFFPPGDNARKEMFEFALVCFEFALPWIVMSALVLALVLQTREPPSGAP